MQAVRYLILLGAMSAAHAMAQPLHAAVTWMAEAQPFDRTAIARHFGAQVETKCAGVAGAMDCIATGDGVELRWRADDQRGSVLDGHAHLRLAGCMRRREVEEKLGVTLSFSPDSVAGRSALSTLSARYWISGRSFRVDVTFDKTCARSLIISTLQF